MCGIAGIFGKKIGDNEISEAIRMRDELKHRGPDAEGMWVSDRRDVVLVHRRLSILDLTDAGKQPMVSKGRYVISYNGEIYNYKELTSKLKTEKNISFLGTSDTEVLLYCFEEYGVEKTLTMCKGMFAIALYDRQEQTLLLVRDRMGEKPLYYGYVNNNFCFASELKCLEKISHMSMPLDYTAINEFIGRGYITGNKTVYNGIYKLRPGEMLCIDKNYNILKQCFYWNHSDAILSGKKMYAGLSLEDAAIQLEQMLTDTISGQMLSDVPLGAFLSSGIDSTLVVAIMQKLSPTKIKTYSIGVEDNELNEAKEAKKIAEYLGTEHTELYISEQDMKDIIPLLPDIYSEPFGDPSAIPSLLVSKLAKTSVSVSLTGDGGDELFGGYPWYQYCSLPRKWKMIRKIPTHLRCFLGSKMCQNSWCMSHEEIAKRAEWFQATSEESLYDIMKYGILSLPNYTWCMEGNSNQRVTDFNVKGIENISEKIMHYDAITYLPEDILVKMDRAAMSCSLETRAPFLDRDIVQFAGGISVENKVNEGISKVVLREILYKYVPPQLICRKKKGFSIPVNKWLLEDKKLNIWANDLLNVKRIKEQGILCADKVDNVWKEYGKQGKYSIQVWNLLMFESWYENKKNRK